VRTEVRGPARGGPFPTLLVSWDPEKVGITAGELGRQLLAGEPRIMTHAEGEGYEFVIRPVAMNPGEYKMVAERLLAVFRAAPRGRPAKPSLAAPAADISGAWDVEIEYEVGAARHRLYLTARENQVTGAHTGWAFRGDVRGHVDGSRVELRSALPVGGMDLAYHFAGRIEGDGMSGEIGLGANGRARWRAVRAEKPAG